MSGALVCYVNLRLLEFPEIYLHGLKTIYLTVKNVLISGIFSDWSKILAVVPQWSLLDPLFFLIFINDIVNEIGSCILLFTDDTSLFINVDDPISSSDRLNVDLVKILQWAETWLVTLILTKQNHF